MRAGARLLAGARLSWSFEVQRQRMQAGFKFFTKRVIYQTLSRNARKPFERLGNQRQAVMRLPARPSACVPGVQR